MKEIGTKEELDLNSFFGQKSLQETASSIGDCRTRRGSRLSKQ